MKICVIGFPRSRSSLLLETISIYHNIPLLGEDINALQHLIPKRNFKEDTVLPEPPQQYFNSLRLLLTKNNRKGQGVIRFHPLQLSFMPYSVEIVNFDLYDFKQYDKIYFTTRNHIDTIASLFVAEQLNTYTYQSKDAVFKNINTMTISDTEVIQDHVYAEIVASRLKKYFADNSIQYIELDYDEIPEYLEQNYSGAVSSHVETNYDYKSIISNYSDIDRMYKEIYAPMTQLVDVLLSKGRC